MLSIELWKLISLELHPYKLAVCKELTSMYTDFWFQDKLKQQYPDKELWTPTTFKDLYKKSLKTSDIFWYNDNTNNKKAEFKEKLSIQGIPEEKAARSASDSHFILTFNGELWLHKSKFESRQVGLTLYDTHVINIENNTYVKYVNKDCYEWFLTYGGNNFTMPSNPKIKDGICKSLAKMNTPIISIAHENYFICALTEYKLYCFSWESDEFEVTTFDLKIKAVKITYNVHYFFILTVDGNIIVFDPWKQTLVPGYKSVTNIFESLIQFENNTNLILTYKGDPKKDKRSNPTLLGVIENSVHYSVSQMTNSVHLCSHYILLIHNQLYSYNYVTKVFEKHKQFLNKHVKHIEGSGYELYLLM